MSTLMNDTVPTRTLGRTGEKVSMLGLGGFHIGKPKLSDAEAIRIVRTAIDAGLTFMDNSWDYNDGDSEIRLGKALKDGYRAKAFVMTKVDGRTKKEAAKQLDESLQRLRVDHVDLLQHHEMIRFEDADRIFAEDGAMETFWRRGARARSAISALPGTRTRMFTCICWKKPRSSNFHFDAVQMPLNLMDAHFRSFEKLVLPVLVAEGIGVLGMKSMGDSVLLKSNMVAPAEYLRYALSLPYVGGDHGHRQHGDSRPGAGRCAKFRR